MKKRSFSTTYSFLFPLFFTAPNFVSSMEDEDNVYFFFRENAVEYINCGKVSSQTSVDISEQILTNLLLPVCLLSSGQSV